MAMLRKLSTWAKICLQLCSSKICIITCDLAEEKTLYVARMSS